MTITISEQSYWELEEAIETTQYDPCDPLDIMWSIPKQLGRGYYRHIELRSGLELEICNIRQRDRVIVETPETPNGLLAFHFHILGQHQDKYTQVGNNEYAIYGSGLALKQAFESSAQKALEVEVSC
jgi:hypothetical protein